MTTKLPPGMRLDDDDEDSVLSDSSWAHPETLPPQEDKSASK